jgi:uncharacterized protein YegL
MSASTDNYQSEIDFLQKVDRIITGDVKIRLREIRDSSGNLAYANLKKRSINLNFKLVNDKYAMGDKMLFIALCKGFNYHELAHLLFCKHHRLTIPHNDAIMSILNALQDGRDETLMSRLFARTRNHFENCFMRVIHTDKEKMNPTMFLATHSRRLIITSDEVKQYWEVVFRKAFGDETTDEVKTLTDEYIVTSSPRKQLDIAERIFSLLHKNAKNHQQTMDNLESFDTSSKNTLRALADALETLSKLSPEDKRELERLAKQIRKEQAKKSGGGSKLSDETQKEIDNNEQQNDLLNQKQKELEELQREHRKSQNDYKDGDKEIMAMKKTSAGEPDAKKRKEIDEKISAKSKELEQIAEKTKKRIDEAGEKIKEIGNVRAKISHDEISKQAESKAQELVESLQDELLDDLETIYKNDGGGYGAGQDDSPDFDDAGNNPPLEIEARHNISSRKLQDVIREIRNSQRKGFVEGQASGKVNMQKAMNIPKTGNLNVFKKFIPDKRLQTRIGVIIILDSSGSMTDGKFNRALQSTWIIQDAMTKTGNPTLIMEFGTTTRIVKPFKASGVFKRHLHQGNTFIVPPLIEAKRQIKLSSKLEHIEHWLVCMITDGDWSDSEKAEEIIDELNKKDVETMFVHIPGNDGQKISEHKCKHTATILDVDELSNLLRTCIKKMQMNIQNKIKRKGE